MEKKIVSYPNILMIIMSNYYKVSVIYIYIFFETEVNVIGFKSCGIYIAFIFYHILNKKKKKKELSYRVPYIIN